MLTKIYAVTMQNRGHWKAVLIEKFDYRNANKLIHKWMSTEYGTEGFIHCTRENFRADRKIRERLVDWERFCGKMTRSVVVCC